MNPEQPAYQAYDGMQPNPALQFMIDFALQAGNDMVARRTEAIVSRKPDGTDLTDLDEKYNREFIAAVHAWTNGCASVLGEEASLVIPGSDTLFVIDPIDGTYEFTKEHKENGEPLADHERTTCLGVAMFEDEILVRSVVFNPFRNELFAADDELGGAFLNGQPLWIADGSVGQQPFGPNIPYDYAYREGGSPDPRCLQTLIGRPPRGDYSAIYQACQVAKGEESVFAIFCGNTIYDIAPGAKIVEQAAGMVTDGTGYCLEWPTPKGAIYSNGIAHPDIVRVLSTRSDCRSLDQH